MPQRNPLLLPIAVLVAVCVIGVAAFIALRKTDSDEDLRSTADLRDVRPLSDKDWVFGNPQAPIVYVVYSDFECPYCKTFHKTMHQLMAQYGKDGNVAWVFRHLPFVQLHSKSPTEHLAAECVGEAGGNDAFWRFADILFEATPSNDQLDLTTLPALAEQAGVSRAKFEACMRSDRLMRRVQEDFQEAVEAGATGSPYTVILASGQQIRVEGAQLYPAMQAVMETLLRQAGEPSMEAPERPVMVDDVFSGTTTTQSPPLDDMSTSTEQGEGDVMEASTTPRAL